MAKENERKEAKERKRKQDGGLLINPLGNTARAREGAHAHARRLPCTCSYAEAGDAAAEIVANCFPHCAKDFALWAWYCRWMCLKMRLIGFRSVTKPLCVTFSAASDGAKWVCRRQLSIADWKKLWSE